MKYSHENWTIKELIEKYGEGLIDLSPPYQRNLIWTSKAQKLLIDTIIKGQPIPNFFLLEKENKKMEMVDGQQRARTILSYYRKDISDLNGVFFDGENLFLNYVLNVTMITDLLPGELIEKYYALVNRSGLRLNRPELIKADYYDTKFLSLTHKLVGIESFQGLKLFTASSVNRMNDIELVSELVALLKFGIFDKKTKVDQLYETDITEKEYRELFQQFQGISETLSRLSLITPISKTRYRQRNDLYTLFHFFNKIKEVSPPTIDSFYRLLLKIGSSISPSQKNCDPLKEYAVNCVTQSNSKTARKARHSFLVDLLLNTSPEPTPTQSALLDFFKISAKDMIKISDFYILDPEKINDQD